MAEDTAWEEVAEGAGEMSAPKHHLQHGPPALITTPPGLCCISEIARGYPAVTRNTTRHSSMYLRQVTLARPAHHPTTIGGRLHLHLSTNSFTSYLPATPNLLHVIPLNLLMNPNCDDDNSELTTHAVPLASRYHTQSRGDTLNFTSDSHPRWSHCKGSTALPSTAGMTL